MNTKLFYAISKRLRDAEEELNKQKSLKSFGSTDFIKAKTRFDTLQEVYNLLYICD